MKNLFKNYQENIKERNNIEKRILLFEGILLILISILVLIFNFDKPSTFTILYLFPISLIIIGIENIVYASKTKDIDNKYFLVYVIEGIFYLLTTLYLVFNFIPDKYMFITILSSFIILRNILRIFKFKKLSILEFINMFIIIVISTLSIIFNKYIIDNLYLYLIILYILYGIKKIIIYFLLSKKS